MKARERLPGDPTRAERIDRLLRVDLAGEYGAKRIYEGQLAILGKSAMAPALRHMYRQELAHLAAFEQLAIERRARPSLLFPLWHAAGFALGAATAMMGPKAAMACTVAVEEVIDDHYRRQIAELDEGESELRDRLETFRTEEVEHRDQAIAAGAEEAPAYPLLRRAIGAGARLAIWLAERV